MTIALCEEPEKLETIAFAIYPFYNLCSTGVFCYSFVSVGKWGPQSNMSCRVIIVRVVWDVNLDFQQTATGPRWHPSAPVGRLFFLHSQVPSILLLTGADISYISQNLKSSHRT